MDSLSPLAQADVAQSLTRVRAVSMRGYWVIAGSLAAFASLTASATSAAETPHFQLVGSGTLQLDQPVLQSGNVQLKATLTPSEAAVSVSAPAQDGGRFSLTALLSTSSLVCYNDTIFRDDFDGDGF